MAFKVTINVTVTDSSLWIKSAKYSQLEAIAYSLMVGLGETFLAAYVLERGGSDVASGLIAVLPMIIGTSLQLVTLPLFNRIQRFRLIVVCAALIQAISLSLLSIQQISQNFIFILTTLYWTMSFIAGPAWNAWIGVLIPASHRVHFFAKRARLCQIFTLVGLLLGGTLLHYSNTSELKTSTFSLIFLIAALFRVLSASLLFKHRDVHKNEIDHIWEKDLSISKSLFSKEIIPFLVYLVLLHSTVYIAAPYFNPYMLRILNLDYVTYSFLISVTFITRIFSFSAMTHWADKKGPQTVLWIGTFFIFLTPGGWAINQNFTWLIFMQIISGLGWGFQDLGATLYVLERFKPKDRSLALSLVNFVSSISMLMGTLLGAWILTQHGVSSGDYHTIFTLSTLGRFLAVASLPFLTSAKRRQKLILYMRILGLRPTMGGVIRPLLYIAKPKRSSYDDSRGKK